MTGLDPRHDDGLGAADVTPSWPRRASTVRGASCRSARACADHSAIVEAIRDGDGPAAGRLCEEHFRATTMMAG